MLRTGSGTNKAILMTYQKVVLGKDLAIGKDS